MTPLTIPAKSTAMDIICPVTVAALTRSFLPFFQWPPMTQVTSQSFVLSIELEISLLIVIKHPQ